MRVGPGINIQYPISAEIVNGRKSVETRTYPLPSKFVGREMFLVETPGKQKLFRARIIGIIVFGESFQYKSKEEFRKDLTRHRVAANSEWDWGKKPKWGWPIKSFRALDSAVECNFPRGIVYTNTISI